MGWFFVVLIWHPSKDQQQLWTPSVSTSAIPCRKAPSQCFAAVRWKSLCPVKHSHERSRKITAQIKQVAPDLKSTRKIRNSVFSILKMYKSSCFSSDANVHQFPGLVQGHEIQGRAVGCGMVSYWMPLSADQKTVLFFAVFFLISSQIWSQMMPNKIIPQGFDPKYDPPWWWLVKSQLFQRSPRPQLHCPERQPPFGPVDDFTGAQSETPKMCWFVMGPFWIET